MLYAYFGPYGGGQILQSASGGFYLSTNTYVKITPTMGNGDYTGRIEKTIQLGSDFGHAERQAAEQRLLKAIDKHLEHY